MSTHFNIEWSNLTKVSTEEYWSNAMIVWPLLIAAIIIMFFFMFIKSEVDQRKTNKKARTNQALRQKYSGNRGDGGVWSLQLIQVNGESPELISALNKILGNVTTITSVENLNGLLPLTLDSYVNRQRAALVIRELVTHGATVSLENTETGVISTFDKSNKEDEK